MGAGDGSAGTTGDGGCGTGVGAGAGGARSEAVPHDISKKQARVHGRVRIVPSSAKTEDARIAPVRPP
jgi:hypothetical protein